jgi:putative colanic acid biosynthesis acetyltransferase WcaF
VPHMAFRNRPIALADGAWVGAQAFIGPGVTLGIEAVVTAGSVATRSQPPEMICSGNPCRPLRHRWTGELCLQEIDEPSE